MYTSDLFQPLTEKKKKPKPTKPEKWAYAKSEAKKKFDVYPSAYANAWAAKKYKELGGGWRMGEDIDEADQQSDAPSKTYGNQKLVDIMRKASEVPGTGLSNDQRMFVAMYDELEDAVEKIGDVEKQNQELRQQVAKQAQPAAKAAAPAAGKEQPAKEPTAAQVKAQPAAEPAVQQVVQNITQVLQRAEQSAETPEQQKELAAAKERIADLESKMSKLSNADVKAIEQTFVQIEKGGIKMGDVKRLLRTVDKRIEQSAKEKQAAQQPQQQTQQPKTGLAQKAQGADITDIETKVKALDDRVTRDLGQANTIIKQVAANDEQQNKVIPQLTQKLDAIIDLSPRLQARFPEYQAAPAQDNIVQFPQRPVRRKVELPDEPLTGTDNESINEQEQETFDFRLPAARVVGVLDDFFATKWDGAFKYFEKTFNDEENDEEEDPWGEGLTQLENAFLVPATIVKKLNTLTNAFIDLEDYHTQIYNHPEYNAMFGQVMFPAFKGKIYNKPVKASETKMGFDNDLQFFEYYFNALTTAVKTKIHPFMKQVKEFVETQYAENKDDNHAMMQYFVRNVWNPYMNEINKLHAAREKLKPVVFNMRQILSTKPEKQGELFERKKKKKKSKSKKAFGGYYFPGYHYYGQGTAEISDGGGDGGGESMFEVITKNRTPEETGSLDSYYGRRRQPHKVVDGKRVELTDREEIQQYLDAYENQTDRKDYGDLDETRLYFRTVATLAESLEQDFGMRQDDRGWYLTPRSGRQRILDAERAFGEPRIL